MKNPTKISIIVPTYQEAGNIPALAGRLYAAAAGRFELEMMIVDVFTYDDLGNRLTHNNRAGTDIAYSLVQKFCPEL